MGLSEGMIFGYVCGNRYICNDTSIHVPSVRCSLIGQFNKRIKYKKDLT